jgi:signal transduction histidine kinase
VPEPIDIPVLIDSVLRLYSNKLESKNIRVMRELADCPPMHGVAGELKQVVSNLISNAIDAVSARGTIRIALEPAGEAKASTVQMVVEDDGPGISPQDLDRIFEPFFTTKKDVGTGLGLWVTREIIERHGGSIIADSRNKKAGNPGARFVIHLPCTSRREAEEPPAMVSCTDGRRAWHGTQEYRQPDPDAA